jgi:serine protease Do
MEASGNIVTTLWNKLRSGNLAATFSLLAVLSIGILAGSMLTGSVSAHQQKVDSSDARPLIIPNPVSLSNGFSAIVKQVGPAVVNINTESLPKQSKAKGKLRITPQNPEGGDEQGGDQGDMQDFFNRFFGGQVPGGQMPEQGPRRALGSGFIVDNRGYIITNNHVVDGADKIYVKLATDPQNDVPGDPGRPATVVGTDKETDIAVIKIDPKGLNLPTVKLGNSDGAQVGDWVLAIGSPFGLSQTVSAGIVSARNRSIDEGPGPGGTASNQFQKFIQTDAAINPGNSGGPLVDMTGAVIGMNTAIYTQSAGSEGIGFAMPSNTIASVYNMLISPDHKVIRGSIGIQFQAAESSAVGRVYGFANGGVMIGSVTPGFPAAKAGLEPNDVIVSVDGKPVKDGDELVAIISAKHPGETVKIGYLRNGKKETAEVGIADRAKLNASLGDGSATDDTNSGADSDAGVTTLGITVAPTTQADLKKAHVSGGVTITSVKSGSFAEGITLIKGLIITEINRKPVTDVATYNAIVKGLKSGDDVVFVIHDPNSKNTGNTFVGGTLP